MKLQQIVFFSFLVLVGCAVNQTRHKIYGQEISFRSGVFEDKSWDDSLSMNRVSWYQDANVSYEILLGKLDQNSPFANWLGADRLKLATCADFYIGAIYTGINAVYGSSYLLNELKKSGLEEISILDFSLQLKSHQNFKDWKLGRHHIYGFCAKNKNHPAVIVNIPGFKPHKML